MGVVTDERARDSPLRGPADLAGVEELGHMDLRPAETAMLSNASGLDARRDVGGIGPVRREQPSNHVARPLGPVHVQRTVRPAAHPERTRSGRSITWSECRWVKKIDAGRAGNSWRGPDWSWRHGRCRTAADPRRPGPAPHRIPRPFGIGTGNPASVPSRTARKRPAAMLTAPPS